ncbi:pimeloyl-ACP methyl ester carboxylesterase [Caulobacter ginsengisoli]|uniref:Pimeloyl-ACP methyl ester carboxylesterase n=1 Tax=Caulobacter ginsengisoli TaxID=400775 RepID=A0ABU0IT67_9CAUL|nr:alpha/beta hydrolase [Caulobacter ginsengisoli]MDQ0464162.1 pimeloyl-ACP methyl ester carboxylesterase [Caulobacter ginsengisoli]
MSEAVAQRRIQAGEVTLNIAEAGPAEGPLVILLHGFPEFWFGWREQIGPLAAAGFRVAAPDQRGYNLSDKPTGAKAYRLDALAADVLALADALGAQTFSLVGHDWGASVAWWLATVAPERIERMAILNAPHPALWRREMLEDPEQRRKSRYVQMLRIPLLPELMVRAGGYKGLADAFKQSTRPDAFDPEAMAAYRAAWMQPGALTATLNWYRALFLQALPVPPAGSLTTPTLVLWGDQDAFARPDLAEASAALCAKAEVRHFPQASHWLAHDEPEAVSAALLDFLKSA